MIVVGPCPKPGNRKGNVWKKNYDSSRKTEHPSRVFIARFVLWMFVLSIVLFCKKTHEVLAVVGQRHVQSPSTLRTMWLYLWDWGVLTCPSPRVHSRAECKCTHWWDVLFKLPSYEQSLPQKPAAGWPWAERPLADLKFQGRKIQFLKSDKGPQLKGASVWAGNVWLIVRPGLWWGWLHCHHQSLPARNRLLESVLPPFAIRLSEGGTIRNGEKCY